ncbi:MAG: hypothetical protein K0S07_1172 [Chlamydiales bacterium]|jgi:hypothetical protein|nr:hypothetical protein [Chlamydiales bacterium]
MDFISQLLDSGLSKQDPNRTVYTHKRHPVFHYGEPAEGKEDYRPAKLSEMIKGFQELFPADKVPVRKTRLRAIKVLNQKIDSHNQKLSFLQKMIEKLSLGIFSFKYRPLQLSAEEKILLSSLEKRKSLKAEALAQGKELSEQELIAGSSLDHLLCQGDKKCILYAVPNNGLGDIACALKFANQLVDRLGVKPENIVIASDDPQLVAIFNVKNFSVSSIDQAAQVKDAVIQLSLPDTTKSPRMKIAESKLPTLCLSEYNCSVNKDWSGEVRDDEIEQRGAFGLGSSHVGILIDHSLAGFAYSAEATEPTERLKKLKLASPLIQEAVLGHSFEEEKEEQLIQDFAKNSKLYFGYAFGIMTKYAFTEAILEMEKEQSEDCVFFFPGKGGGFEELRDIYQKNGVGKLEIVSYDKEKGTIEEKTYQLEGEGTKKVRIICGPVAHQDIFPLLLASEKESLATGDQSFSEAISANKNFVYETLSHKRSLGESIDQLYASKQGKRAFFEGIFDSTSTSPLIVTARNFAKALQKGKENGYQSIHAINLAICQEKDCLLNIADVMNELLLKNGAK